MAKSMTPTDRQKEVLRFVVEFIEQHGYQPSRREIAEHFGVAPNSIMGHLRGLEQRGFIDLSNGKDRAMRIPNVYFRAIKVKEGELAGCEAGNLD